MAQDRPTAAELVEASRDFLENEALPQLSGRVAFHARVAVNVLGMVSRELQLEAGHESAERRRAVALLGPDAESLSLREIEVELARRIRDGSLDARRAEVIEHVRKTVDKKLVIANPKYLEG